MGGFHWTDGERTIVFGRGKLAEAISLLGEPGFTLLTTRRAMQKAPEIAAAAGTVHEVPTGRVDEVAAGLREHVEGELLVALGGGRVIDTAKALAAADPPRRVAAVPTTLSGAEMTAVHRQVAGLPMETTPRVRPAIVVNDPALSASQPFSQLAQSAANALGHAFEGPMTPLRSPVSTLAAIRAVRLIAGAYASGGLGAGENEREVPARDDLALGALLAGYVIGSTHYGLHHVLAQTLVRFAGVGHGAANAIMLPHSLSALERRRPAELAEFTEALGESPRALAERIRDLTGVSRLRDVITDGDEGRLALCAEEAAGRPDLALTPPTADRQELLALYRAAW
jgi:alcohol dehydrogenase class IV